MKVCSGGEKKEEVKDSGVGFKLIMKMVWLKLVKNPNSYASLFGLSWALASGRYKNSPSLALFHPLLFSLSLSL